jgi:hypothetical protein
MLLVLALASATADASSVHRQVSGVGHTISFHKGDPIFAGTISLRNDGRTWYDCYFPSAPANGKLTTGVIKYYRSEIHGKKNCWNTTVSPGPRVASGDSKWLGFTTSPRRPNIQGYAIEAGGNTYINCYYLGIPWSGRVLSGVRNPYPLGELRKNLQSCRSTRPVIGYRHLTGDGGQSSFSTYVGVLGAYIQLDSGQKYHDCYIDQAANTSSGFVISGVVSYWPDDLKGHPLPSCGSAGTVVSNPAPVPSPTPTPTPSVSFCNTRYETGQANTKTFPGGCIAVGFRITVDGVLMGNHEDQSSQCWTETPIGSTVMVTDGVYGLVQQYDKNQTKYGHC